MHWKGFSHEENKWKKVSELSNAPDVVKDFHHRHLTAPQSNPCLCLHYVGDSPPSYPELNDLPPDVPCTCPTCHKVPLPPITTPIFKTVNFLFFHNSHIML